MHIRTDEQARGSGLVLAGICAGYQMGDVLRSVHLYADPGEVVCVLGRNGAGKSTLARAAMGVLPLSAGTITVAGRDLTRADALHRVRGGLRWVPQDRSLFPGLSVQEHLVLADQGGVDREEVLALFPVLGQRMRQQATTLSGGERKLLGIACALLGRPSVLILDEPSEGVAPKMVRTLADAVQLAAGRGCAVVLTEQNLGLAVAVGQRGYLMERGAVVDQVDPATLTANTAALERIGL
jgi:branched-chain amino acid transport system ATP-binding protein